MPDIITLPAGDHGDLRYARKSGFEIVAEPGARVRSLTLSQCKDVTVRGELRVDFKPDEKTTSGSPAVDVVESHGVQLAGLDITGGPSIVGVPEDHDKELPRPGDNILGWPTGRGVSFERCSEVSLADSRIEGFHKGIAFSRSSDIDVLRNSIRRVRTSMIVGSITRARFRHNVLSDSRPWKRGGKGDHADCMHFWTKPDWAAPEGIVVEENLMDQGEGEPLISVYFDDNRYGVGFKGVSVARNTILNGHGSGMRFESVEGEVLDNTFLQTSGTYKDAPSIEDVVAKARSDGRALVNALRIAGNSLTDVNGKLAPKYPDNTWRPALGPDLAHVIEAARAAALARISGPVDWQARAAELEGLLAAANGRAAVSEASAALLAAKVEAARAALQ